MEPRNLTASVALSGGNGDGSSGGCDGCGRRTGGELQRPLLAPMAALGAALLDCGANYRVRVHGAAPHGCSAPWGATLRCARRAGTQRPRKRAAQRDSVSSSVKAPWLRRRVPETAARTLCAMACRSGPKGVLRQRTDGVPRPPPPPHLWWTASAAGDGEAGREGADGQFLRSLCSNAGAGLGLRGVRGSLEQGVAQLGRAAKHIGCC